MSIEAGARAGMIAPDQVTFDYLKGRPKSPKGSDWDKAVEYWKKLRTDEGAKFDKSVTINVDNLKPMVTFGTNPGMVINIDQQVPIKEGSNFNKALNYMQIESGNQMTDLAVDVVFVGSCTNGRLSDIKETARILAGRKIADNVRMLVVPGSESVKKNAEDQGLDKIIKAAGAEWREAGCSMCIAMNGDLVKPGQLCVSTSNRNFEGRQGVGARTILASPATAAASAVTGFVCDPRKFL